MEMMSTSGLNMESFVNNVAGDVAKSDIEDKKISKASVRATTEKIHDQREEKIQNLMDQLKGVGGAGGCFKFLRAAFKIIDFLTKPLSVLTLNKLNLSLSTALESLKDAKNRQKILGLKINGEQIQKVLEGLKKLLGNDMETLKLQDDRGAKETERILQILDEIDGTFKAAGKI